MTFLVTQTAMNKKIRAPRSDPAERRAKILATAYELADSHGFKLATRLNIAMACGVSTGLVSKYFGDRDALRNEIINRAFQCGNAAILVDAMEAGCTVPDISPRTKLGKAIAACRIR